MELLNLMGLNGMPWQSLVDSAEAASIVAYAAAKTVGGVVQDPQRRADILATNLAKVGPEFSASAYTVVAAKQRDAAAAWARVIGAAMAAHTMWRMDPAKIQDAVTAQIATNDAKYQNSGLLAYADQLDRAAKLAEARVSTGETLNPSCPNGYTVSNGSCVKVGSVTPTGGTPGGSGMTLDPMEQNCLNVGGVWDDVTGSCLAQSGDAGGDPFPIAKKFPTALVVGGLAAVGLVAWFLLRKPRGGVAGYGRDYYDDDDGRAPSFPGLGHGGFLDRRGGHTMWASSPITGRKFQAGYHWHRPSGWRSR